MAIFDARAVPKPPATINSANTWVAAAWVFKPNKIDLRIETSLEQKGAVGVLAGCTGRAFFRSTS